MKKIGFIWAVLVSALFLGSCSKDNDSDLGGEDISDIPAGKVALNKYGVRAFFPEEGWGNSVETKWNSASSFARECTAAYFKEDRDSAGNYTTVIYFSRFLDECLSGQTDSVINDFHVILEGLLDEGENDPSLEYVSVGDIEFATVSTYVGSRIETLDKKGFYQDNYFVQEGKHLYMITVSMPDSLKNSEKYNKCMEIVNSVKFN